MCSMVLMTLVIMAIWWCDRRIAASAAGRSFDDVGAIPHNRVGVVLGTSERGRGGGINQYFAQRMSAAATLYHSGKVDQLLLSGDNGRVDYNEPEDMRRALIRAGVDSADITLDHAGFRTFDSMVRAHSVFGQERFTVISQRFHNERAIHIAQRSGLDVIGFNAPDVSGNWRTRIREKLARVKVFLDILFDVEPKFLGDPVVIGEQEHVNAR